MAGEMNIENLVEAFLQREKLLGRYDFSEGMGFTASHRYAESGFDNEYDRCLRACFIHDMRATGVRNPEHMGEAQYASLYKEMDARFEVFRTSETERQTRIANVFSQWK